MNLIYNQNKKGKIDFFYQPSKEVIVPWAQFRQQFFLRYYPWLIWPRRVCGADLGWWPFHPLDFWTGCLSIVSFLVPPFFSPSFFHVSKLKYNWIMYAKWNEPDYKIRSLGLKRVGKWTMCPTTHTKPREVISHYNTLLPLVVTAKSVKVYGL